MREEYRNYALKAMVANLAPGSCKCSVSSCREGAAHKLGIATHALKTVESEEEHRKSDSAALCMTPWR